MVAPYTWSATTFKKAVARVPIDRLIFLDESDCNRAIAMRHAWPPAVQYRLPENVYGSAGGWYDTGSQFSGGVMSKLISAAPNSSMFNDPVTYDVMVDPVVCDDGRTYDRTTAQRLGVSPFTRKPLRILVDNVALRSDIFEANPAVGSEFEKRRSAHRRFLVPEPNHCPPLKWLRPPMPEVAYLQDPQCNLPQSQKLARLESLACEYPRDPWPRIARAAILGAQGEFDEAQRDAATGFELEPSWQAMVGLADIYLRSDSFEQAKKCADLLERFDPGNTDAQLITAEILCKRGDLAKARALVHKLLASELSVPGRQNCLHQLVRLEYLAARDKEVVRIVNRTPSAYITSTMAAYRGLSRLVRGNISGAISDLIKAGAMQEPNNVVDALRENLRERGVRVERRPD